MRRRRLVGLGVLLAALVSAHATLLVAEEPDRLGRAVQLHDQGRRDEARKLLHEVLASEPNHHRALWNMGLLSMSDQQHDEAIRWFDEAIAVDGRIAEYHLWRGYAYARKLETSGLLTRLFLAPKIRGSFEQAVQLDPRNVKARTALMRYYERAPALLGGSRTKAALQGAEIRALQSDPQKTDR
jgi:tetratricopeptide (TPR) repeat protein